MDLGVGVIAARCAKGRIAHMVFKAPVKIGDLITCTATLQKVGTTSMIIIETWKRNLAYHNAYKSF
jgi:acyl-CoA thioesterase YciA